MVLFYEFFIGLYFEIFGQHIRMQTHDTFLFIFFRNLYFGFIQSIHGWKISKYELVH